MHQLRLPDSFFEKWHWVFQGCGEGGVTLSTPGDSFASTRTGSLKFTSGNFNDELTASSSMATTCRLQLVGIFFLRAPETTWSLRQKSPANIGPVSKRDPIRYGTNRFPPPTHTRTHTPEMAACRFAFLHVWMERKKEKYNHMRCARTRKEQVQATFV